MTTVRFLDTDCTVMKHRYANGRVALSLIDGEGPVATATVNLPDATLGKNEILVKDWAENRGLLQALVEAGSHQADRPNDPDGLRRGARSANCRGRSASRRLPRVWAGRAVRDESGNS